jgi:hypothetical protein
MLVDLRLNAFSKACDAALILPDDPRLPIFVSMLKLFYRDVVYCQQKASVFCDSNRLA